MVLEANGIVMYRGGSPSVKVEVEVAHLGRALEISIKDSAVFTEFGCAFSNLVIKTHI